MNATQQLHDLGQSLWLDNITRDLLNSGTLQRYIDELSVAVIASKCDAIKTAKNQELASVWPRVCGFHWNNGVSCDG